MFVSFGIFLSFCIFDDDNQSLNIDEIAFEQLLLSCMLIKMLIQREDDCLCNIARNIKNKILIK